MGVMQRLFFAALLAVGAALLTFALAHDHFSLAPFGMALGVWVMAGALTEWLLRVKAGSAGMEEVVRRARNLPRSAYGTLLAHFGVGIDGGRHRGHHGLPRGARAADEAGRQAVGLLATR